MWNVWLEVRLLRVAWRQNIFDCIPPYLACPVSLCQSDILNARFVTRHSAGHQQWPRQASDRVTEGRLQWVLNDNHKKKEREIRVAVESQKIERHGAYGTDCACACVYVGVARRKPVNVVFSRGKFFDAGALCWVSHPNGRVTMRSNPLREESRQRGGSSFVLYSASYWSIYT